MADEEAKRRGNWDSTLKNAGLVLGLLTTSITSYLAWRGSRISADLANLQKTSAAIQAGILATEQKQKDLSLANTRYQTGARLVAELYTQNAREFAANWAEGKLLPDWPDRETQTQFDEHVKKWNVGTNLMTGTGGGFLQLRQVVLLRLKNIGGGPVRDLKISMKQRDFDNANGGLVGKGERYDEMRFQDWPDASIGPNTLFEAAPSTEGMRSQMIVPLAHVSGGNIYFGRVLVPVRATWHDERLNEPSTLAFDLASEGRLRNALISAVLGRPKK